MGLDTLHDFFTRNGTETPLFIRGGREYSFAEIAALVRKYAKIAQSLDERDCVLHSSDNLLFIIGYFALLHAGKRIVLAGNLRSNTLEALGTRQIFADAPPPGGHQLDFNPGPEAELRPFDPQASDICFFSSGSTGTPKRIIKTFHSLYEELRAVDTRLGPEVKSQTTTLATVNLSHLYGMTFALLYSMAKGFLIDTSIVSTPEDLEARLGLHKNVFLVSSPAFLDRLGRYQENYFFPKKPYLITSSGGPLSQAGAMAGRDLLGISPLEVFGSTETGVVGNRRQLEDETWTLFDFVNAKAGEDERLLVFSSFMDEKEFLMGDAAVFLTERRFALKGRTDRLVKIEETRVSLPELETGLQAHPYVSRAVCAPVTGHNKRKRIGACVCLSLSGRRFYIQEGRLALVALLKEHLQALVDPLGIPAKWRFVAEIPLNEQGKIQMSEIQAVLASNITEPVVLELDEKGEGKKELLLVFPTDAIYFDGHFPGIPILPGVVQIHFAIHFSGFGKEFSEMSRIKFSRVLKPGRPVKLALECDSKTLSFSYFDDDGLFSKGVLKRV